MTLRERISNALEPWMSKAEKVEAILAAIPRCETCDWYHANGELCLKGHCATETNPQSFCDKHSDYKEEK